MKCLNCAKYPFCIKTTKASDGCNEGIKRKPDDEFTDWLIEREDSIGV